jgi:hypothetical protein
MSESVLKHVRFEVLTAGILRIPVFLDLQITSRCSRLIIHNTFFASLHKLYIDFCRVTLCISGSHFGSDSR